MNEKYEIKEVLSEVKEDELKEADNLAGMYTVMKALEKKEFSIYTTTGETKGLYKGIIVYYNEPVLTRFNSKSRKITTKRDDGGTDISYKAPVPTTTQFFKTLFHLENKGYFINIKFCNRGTPISVLDEHLLKIKSVKLVYFSKENKKLTDEQLSKIRYDKQTWSNIRANEFVNHNRAQFMNITRCFHKDELDKIKKAFENKEEIYINRDGVKRDFSVSTKFENGIFKAFFNSEFHGCGNGSYYLLLNPTTAIYYEDD